MYTLAREVVGSSSIYGGFGKWLPTYELYNYIFSLSFYYISTLNNNGGQFHYEYCYIKNNILVLTSLASLANFKCFSNYERPFVSRHLRYPDILLSFFHKISKYI